MEFRILGLLEVVDEEQVVDVPAAKLRAVLGMLLVHANEVVSADRLAEGVWGHNLPQLAEHLQGMSPASARLSAPIASGPGTRATSSPWVRTGSTPSASSDSSTTLADFTYAEWAQAEIARLRELRLLAIEGRLEARLALGHHEHLFAELDSLVVAHALREHVWAARILALYRAGRQADD